MKNGRRMYRVDVTTHSEMFVVADSANAAISIARSSANEVLAHGVDSIGFDVEPQTRRCRSFSPNANNREIIWGFIDEDEDGNDYVDDNRSADDVARFPRAVVK